MKSSFERKYNGGAKRSIDGNLARRKIELKRSFTLSKTLLSFPLGDKVSTEKQDDKNKRILIISCH